MGIRGRTEATGRGVFYALKEACSYKDDMAALGLEPGLEGKTMAIQGMGNVGRYAGLISQEEGGVKIISVAEYDGAIYNPDGINLKALLKHQKDTGSIMNFKGAKNMDQRKQVLEVECDILVPAALENQIRKDNARKVKAKIIAEAANGPHNCRCRRNTIKERRNDYS